MTLITAPELEPLSLEETKKHCRITHDEENNLVEAYIRGARRAIEKRTGLALLEQTWEAAWPCFLLDGFVLPRPPLLSVTSVKYIDENGTEQTLAADQYTVNTRAFPGEVVPAYNVAWPATRDVPNAVVIRFVAGFGDEEVEVPESILDALRLEVADRYWHREDVDVEKLVSRGAVRSLLANELPYVV